MNTIDLLKGARSKLAQGWVAGSRAVDKDGFFTSAISPAAVKWCALGALDAMLGTGALIGDDSEAVQILDQYVPTKYRHWKLPASRVAQYSNGEGQEAALTLFDTAIRELETPSIYSGCLRGYPAGNVSV